LKKPKDIIDRIIKGRVAKEFSDDVLME